ncbi:hypothetical protein [Undibacterium sp. RuTC16W]|uniref:hypothetical protein n=1 Tax=Undibacterium sp. RuTC16W TaxID=3413048 RepID=UPI003BF33933
MIARYIKAILITGGIIMLLVGLQFIAPQQLLHIQNLVVSDSAGLLFARHWGLLVACLGGLTVYSAYHPPLRAPVIIAVTIEKICLVGVLLASMDDPALKPMLPVIALDGLFIVLFLLYLSGKRNAAE